MFIDKYPGLEAFDSERICSNFRLFIESILNKSPVPYNQEVTREAVRYALKNSAQHRVKFNGSLYSGEVEALHFEDADDLIGFFRNGVTAADIRNRKLYHENA
jgi:hypothetical protein